MKRTERTQKEILIINHYGQQPPYNTMLRHHNWGKNLIRRGYKVTIVSASTIHNTKINMIDKIGERSDNVDGIEYIYIKTPSYTGNGISRMLNLLAFCFGVLLLRHSRPDIIISAGAYLYPFVKIKYAGVPIITDIADLWPESIIEYANYSPKNLMIRALFKLERDAYIKSDAIIFSMEGGVDYLREQKYSDKIDYSKVFHINMGCDVAQKDKELEDISFDLGWNPDEFNVVYCGSIRIANNVQIICDAAKILQDKLGDKIKIHIFGNGDDLEYLKDYVEQKEICNVHFYGRIEKEKLPFILSNAQATLLIYKDVPLWKYGGSQSKLFDYLASGRPIICNVKFGYNLIEKYNCGVIAGDQSAEALADSIEKLYTTDKNDLTLMGQRARKVAEMYDQPILVDELEKVFEYVTKRMGE